MRSYPETVQSLVGAKKCNILLKYLKIWQIVLIVASLLIAVIGWFKPEKVHRILSVTMVVLLLLVAGIQVIMVIDKQKEEDRLNTRLSRVVLGNDSLLTQNTELLNQNKELLFQIEEYQGEIKEQKKTVESLRDFSRVAQLNIFGTTLTVSGEADYLKITSPLSKILEGAYFFIQNTHVPCRAHTFSLTRQA